MSEDTSRSGKGLPPFAILLNNREVDVKGEHPVFDYLSCSKNSITARLNSCGFSMFGWCAVPGITTFFAPAILFSSVSAIPFPAAARLHRRRARSCVSS